MCDVCINGHRRDCIGIDDGSTHIETGRVRVSAARGRGYYSLCDECGDVDGRCIDGAGFYRDTLGDGSRCDVPECAVVSARCLISKNLEAAYGDIVIDCPSLGYGRNELTIW